MVTITLNRYSKWNSNQHCAKCFNILLFYLLFSIIYSSNHPTRYYKAKIFLQKTIFLQEKQGFCKNNDILTKNYFLLLNFLLACNILFQLATSYKISMDLTGAFLLGSAYQIQSHLCNAHHHFCTLY